VSDLAVFVGIVVVAIVGGIWLGMLVARRLGRLIDHDEEQGDD
jgi:hypothetical protein